MRDSCSPSPLFDTIAQWLMDQGLQEQGLGDLIQGLGQRIVAGGIPLHRIGLGGMILHPVYGALNVSWDAQSDTVQDSKYPRNRLQSPEFRNSPFYHSTVNKLAFKRYRIDDDETALLYPIFADFRAEGVTDYFLTFVPYGTGDDFLWADLPDITRGTICAFSTRRFGGFSDKEIDYLMMLTKPLILAIKAKQTHELAQTLLNTYLGAYSGSQVLEGQFERGDGKEIECVLWYSDLRDSTALADRMPLESFLSMVNDYFECAAGAVMDHGGEVLRFIGDAVIAIFPYEAQNRPLDIMADAAIATSKEAIARVNNRNAKLVGSDMPPIRFGVSLHVGSVMYGNIGTERRLEFSVIGPAANEVVRLEDFCKLLDVQVVASSDFKEIYSQDMVSLGTHPAAGVKGGLSAFTLPEFQNSSKTDG